MKTRHPATFAALTVCVLILIAASGTYHAGATPPIFTDTLGNATDLPAARQGSPTALRIDAGGRLNYTDTRGNVWLADTGYIGGVIAGRSTTSFKNTDDDYIYQYERHSMAGYVLPVSNGSYTVRLHFAEDNPRLNAPGRRVFSVYVEGKLIPDIDVFAEAGGLYTALVKSIDVTIEDAQLDIQFVSQVDNPEIKGIEVLPTAGPPPPSPTEQTTTPTATPTRLPTASPTPSPTLSPTSVPSSPTPTPKGPGPAPESRVFVPLVVRSRPVQPLSCGDVEDADDSPEGAARLSLGVTCAGSVQQDAVLGDDWFYVNAPAGRTLVVDLSGMPEGADYDLFVFDGQLSEEESNPRVGSNAPEQVRFSARVAGKYYARVVVYKRAASSPNSYLLRAVIQ